MSRVRTWPVLLLLLCVLAPYAPMLVGHDMLALGVGLLLGMAVPGCCAVAVVPSGLRPVVRCFFNNLDVMRVRFAHAGGRNAIHPSAAL